MTIGETWEESTFSVEVWRSSRDWMYLKRIGISGGAMGDVGEEWAIHNDRARRETR